MVFEKIDRNSWKRNEYFEHYFTNIPCTYSMTVKLDITQIKKKQMKYIIQEQKNTFLNVQVVIWNGLER